MESAVGRRELRVEYRISSSLLEEQPDQIPRPVKQNQHDQQDAYDENPSPAPRGSQDHNGMWG